MLKLQLVRVKQSMIVSWLAWPVSGITQEAKLWVPVKEFPDWVT